MGGAGEGARAPGAGAEQRSRRRRFVHFINAGLQRGAARRRGPGPPFTTAPRRVLGGRGHRRRLRLAEGAAINTPIQGSAAEIIKLAMISVVRRLRSEAMGTRMVLSVHDELVFDVPEAEIQKASTIIKEEMENVIVLEVPLVVEIGLGDNWLEAH